MAEEQLIDLKAELIAAVKEGSACIHQASKLARECDLPTLNQAFTVACTQGHLGMMGLLLHHGADPRDVRDFNLRLTCKTSSRSRYDVVPVVNVLLNLGCDPNAQDGEPLYNAAQAGHAGVVGLLLARGATAHHAGRPAIVTAAIEGHLDATRLLVEAGADPESAISALAHDAVRRSFGRPQLLHPLRRYTAGPDEVEAKQLPVYYYLKGQTMPTLWDHIWAAAAEDD